MKNILLDLSTRIELLPFARVIRDVSQCATPLNLPMLITGAFARDLHLRYRHNILVGRQTEDIDIALAVPDWASFSGLKTRLLETGGFAEASGKMQRLRHAGGLPVDLVPFGGVEGEDRHIVWPPDGAFRMNLFGHREAFAAAIPIVLPEEVRAFVVSVAALALLKIVAWAERHYQAPKKDASDLMLLIKHYVYLDNEERLWSEFQAWTEAEDFDVVRAGARMLGIDIGRLIDADGRDVVATILTKEANPDQSSVLVGEMAPDEPELARRLINDLLQGLGKS